MHYSGSCLCKQLSFTVKGHAIHTAHCHCTECRKTSATWHATHACFMKEQVVWSGDYKLYKYKGVSGNKVEKWFCPNCGSSLATWNEGYKDIIALNLGIFDNIEGIEPNTIYYESRCPQWGKIYGDLQRYSTKPE